MENNKIRNIAILGHLSSGKTSLVEALYSMISGNPKGSVEKGNTISDYTQEEKARMNSIKSAVVPMQYNDYKINLIDVPGSDDFIGEAVAAVHVVKGAVLVLDAQAGVEVQTVKHWNMLKKNGIPTILFLNKMDKGDVHFDQVVEDIRKKLGTNAVPFCYPLAVGEKFDGFVNCIDLVGRKWNGNVCQDIEIPSELKSKVLELNNTMVEAVAETSEELMDKFFAGEELSKDEIYSGLRTGILNGEISPVICGSALKNIGLNTLLDMFIKYMANPSDLRPMVGEDANGAKVERHTSDDEPFSAFVFKTVVDPYSGVSSIFKIYSGTIKVGDEIFIPEIKKNLTVSQLFTVLGGKTVAAAELHAGDIGCVTKVEGLETSMTICNPKNVVVYPKINFPSPVYYKALVPKTKQDEDKLSMILKRIEAEDKSIEERHNRETSQRLIGTLGTGHLNYILEKMRNSYKLDVATEDVKIVYRETIKTKSTDNQGRYIKQSGGSGFYGVVVMDFEPAEENTFTEEIFGGSVPKNYFPAVEKGFFEACEKGLLAGFPVIGVHATLKDGKYHPVDSNELAFKMAAILAFKEAYPKCKPVILEPIIKIAVSVNSDLTGDIISDLNQRRARISGIDANPDGSQVITALVPEAEIIEYVNDLKSITQGAGSFTREFNSYEEAPAYVQEKLIAAAKAAQAQ